MQTRRPGSPWIYPPKIALKNDANPQWKAAVGSGDNPDSIVDTGVPRSLAPNSSGTLWREREIRTALAASGWNPRGRTGGFCRRDMLWLR